EVIAIFLQVFFQAKQRLSVAWPCRVYIGCADERKRINTIRSLSFFIFLLLSTQTVFAFEKLSLDIQQIENNDWQLNGVSLTLFDLNKQTQQLSLSIKQLSLPEPLSGLKFFDIQCVKFSWQENQIDCQKGKAKHDSKFFHSSPFEFSFSITDKKAQLFIQKLKIANGTLSLTAKEEGLGWFVTIKSKGVQLKELHSLLSKTDKKIDDISKGHVNADIQLKGNDKGLNTLLIKAFFEKVTLQANQGTIATESLDVELDLVAKLSDGVWKWEHRNKIKQGELYIEPVYLEIKDKSLSLDTKGLWQQQGDIKLQQAKLTHQDVIEENTEGLVKQKPDYSLDKAHISLDIKDLEQFSTLYMAPFTEQTAVEGIKLKGQLKSEIEVSQSKIKQVSSSFKQLTVIDEQKRISIDNGRGELNWSVNPDFVTPSHFNWKKLKIRAIPIDAGQFKFLLRQKSIKLLEQSRIPLLDGTMTIKQFNWHHKTDDEPTVYFEGEMTDLSLEQLSHAFDWTPLSGRISGYIPGVNYENKKLSIEGGLNIDIFDGTIKINKLASSGMFTDFARFYLDMEIDNLDLHQITQKFEMGGIEGRISGYINDLYLENWEPVTFYAWIGTPENDDSRHRISQKAVENIASIGGGGAADVISKGFLRFFDTFGYDQLGFGCYLQKGVCQLMGVEAAEQGYYIIKGGGIPRIDIIGYNPQVDWKVLMERLSRITATDEVVID
ncbi:MAG: hypothetical protein KAR12_14335, partial [Methylococcales bacterium]|nr:hypothetical protein [Methylococcales bacterium]